MSGGSGRADRLSLASGLRMAVKLKPKKGWLLTAQPSAGRRARTQGRGHLPDPKSKHLLELYTFGTLFAPPSSQGAAGGSEARAELGHTWVSQVFPVLREEK